VKDYLLRKDPDPSPQLEFFRVKEEETHAEIARTCFTYLYGGALAEVLGGEVDDISRFPLLSYAVLHWPEYIRYSFSLTEDIFDLLIPVDEKDSPILKG
jgi:hypothetical protein